MKYIWKWKPKADVSADDAGNYIENLTKKHGGVTPKLLVNESRDKRALLHDCFEWNDGIAAEEYRLEQARHILRVIVVLPEEDDNDEKPPIKIRAFVPVKENNETHFVTIGRAMGDEDLRQQVLKQALDDLIAWKQKYKNLQEFKCVIKSINQLKLKF